MLTTSINSCALVSCKYRMLPECPVRYHGMAPLHLCALNFVLPVCFHLFDSLTLVVLFTSLLWWQIVGGGSNVE